jgi:16S rRNA (cytidine1402-2'-O)-methyltransferase
MNSQFSEMSAILYLIPVTLGDSPVRDVIPDLPLEILSQLKHFVVEDLRSARRYLRKAGIKTDFNDLQFYLLNEHSQDEDLSEMLTVLQKGDSMGILSEAGVPAVADPGAKLTALAHTHDIRVQPLVGPSSILLALMASGMNGQSFRFLGYLPVKNPQRQNSIRQLEKLALETGETQLFMETPYRNMSLLEDLLKICKEDTLLCIAADISLNTEYTKTKTIREWRRTPPDIHKRPAVFSVNRKQ